MKNCGFNRGAITKTEKSLLQTTMDAAIADDETVTAEGNPIGKLPDGLQIHDAVVQSDARGMQCEILDTHWDFLDESIHSVYIAGVRPGDCQILGAARGT